MIDSIPRRQHGPRAGTVIGPADAAILQLVHRYRYLTARQILRLRYASGTLSYVQLKLRLLCEQALLTRFYPPRAARAGSSPAVYQLAARGRRLLRRAGLSRPPRPCRAHDDHHSFWFLAHTVAAIDVLITAELLVRTDRRLELAELLTEYDLRQQAVTVPLPDGTSTTVIPDGWIDLRLDGRQQVAIAFELDRGTTDRRRWQRKIGALLAWADGPYQAQFATTSLTIAVIATPGATRQEILRRWTEAELHRQGRRDQTDLFRFTTTIPETVSPTTLFREPRWRRPFTAALHTLLPAVEEGTR